MATNTAPVTMTQIATHHWRVFIGTEVIGGVWNTSDGWQSSKTGYSDFYKTKEDAAQLLVYAYWKAQKEQNQCH